ncbi:PTS fructose transporter subunit IIA [bacterium]|nr:PTS fructose transporter subunit IIA [bacterium]
MSTVKPGTVGVLLVTHGKLGHQLLHTIRDFMGDLSLAADVLEVRRVQDPQVLIRQGERMIERLDNGGGVLILTDAFGSTPGNTALQVAACGGTHQVRVVSGVNLPMLVRVFNYPGYALPKLTTTAIEGGRRGIVDCQAPNGDA